MASIAIGRPACARARDGSRGVHMRAGYLSRQFRLAYGESSYGYLMTRRIERAIALQPGRPPAHRKEPERPA